jgi:hypothetical protein
MPQKCCVVNCAKDVVAKALCRMHYMRVQRTGEVDENRPDDWGKREKHPAYKVWCNLRRYHYQNISSEWLKDFWKFVADVPEKPEKSQAFRPNPNELWSKDNFYWKQSSPNRENEKELAREWRKQARAANPDYYLDKDLQRNYGITLEWYRNTLKAQNGVCAICSKPESVKIKGKLIAMPVDHNHNTGKARGLLCTQCNRGLGLFRDNQEILKNAILYLIKNKIEK